MSDVLQIPILALPYVVLAGAGAIAPIVWSFRPKSSFWHAAMRFSVVAAAWSCVTSGWLSQPTAAGASDWFRWTVPLALLLEIAGIEAVARALVLRLPRWYGFLYPFGLVLVAGAVLWHPVLSRMSDGLWSPEQGWALYVMAAICLVGIAGILAVGLGRGGLFPGRRVWFVVLVALCAILYADQWVWQPMHRTLFPTSWLVTLGLMLFCGARVRNLPESWDMVVPEVLDASDGFRYGEQTIVQTAVGVLYVGVAGLREVNGASGRAVFHALASELRQMCRGTDRVVWLEGGEYLIILPAIPFQSERSVRARVEDSIRSVMFWVDDRTIAMSDRVNIGWAWGDRGVAFSQVVQQARRSLSEEARRSPPSAAE